MVDAKSGIAQMILRKVISGAQTGVDRAALDAALKAGLPVDSYCTKGGPVEGDHISEKFPFQELETTQYQIRIENNVVVSDGTLIINKGQLTHGTKLSYDYTVKHFMPCLIIQLDDEQVIPASTVIKWVCGQRITTLNIAGPRESKFPEGIYQEAYSYLDKLFAMLKDA
jgi:hypothetical protein